MSKPRQIVLGLAFALLAGLVTAPTVFAVLEACKAVLGASAGETVGLYALAGLAFACVPRYINWVHRKLGISVRV